MVKDLGENGGSGGGGVLRRGKKVFVRLWYGGDCSLCFSYALGISSG